MADKIKKNVSLLGRDFGDFRKNLIDFTKNYFPQTYNDFNESSPGMMFMEMASYVGDVLSYYTDIQLRESILEQAQEKKNVFTIAQAYGYKPKLNVPATTDITVYQLVPAIGSGLNVKPDWDYALTISDGMVIASSTNGDVNFTTIEKVRFNSPNTIVSVYEVDDTTAEPIRYLLKQTVKAISGLQKSQDFTFGSPKLYDKIKLADDNLIDVIKIIDDDGDVWTKVDYLAQETIFEEVENSTNYSLELSQYSSNTPALLRLKKVPKRFITRVSDDGTIDIQFGAGISSQSDEEILPNPSNVGSALYNSVSNMDIGIDPSNFLYSSTYGIAPANSTLTVYYRIGSGTTDNVPSQDLTNIIERIIETPSTGLNNTLYNQSIQSIAVTNEKAASGGRYEETVDEVRNNAMAYFRAQNRAVTAQDYTLRAYAMPPQFGSVSKAFAAPDFQINTIKDDGIDPLPNPLGINLYTLGYDTNGNLTILNDATKHNLKNYISQYRILTDAINIKNAYIVNIGIEFEIIIKPNYNQNEVLLKCIKELKDYFKIDKWSINQPIILTDIYLLLDSVEGVMGVVRPDKDGNGGLQIVSKYGGNYSENRYNIKSATINNIIYPAKDPSIFEIKYPDLDIKGKVSTL